MHRRSRPCHTLSSRPWAERQNLVYGFSVVLAIRQVGTHIPLSPSLGLSQRAETTLLNKFVEISTTTGRFCPWCHMFAFYLQSRRPDSNRQPADYKSAALPLRHDGGSGQPEMIRRLRFGRPVCCQLHHAHIRAKEVPVSFAPVIF